MTFQCLRIPIFLLLSFYPAICRIRNGSWNDTDTAPGSIAIQRGSVSGLGVDFHWSTTIHRGHSSRPKRAPFIATGPVARAHNAHRTRDGYPIGAERDARINVEISVGPRSLLAAARRRRRYKFMPEKYLE